MRHSLTLKALTACVVLATVACAIAKTRADDAWTARKAEYRRPDAPGARGPDPSDDRLWRLGQTLFHDPSLAASRKLACASCHQSEVAWTDHLPRAQGEGSSPLKFRVPTLLNVGRQESFGWIGAFATIADISFAAICSSANMNMTTDELSSRLTGSPSYQAEFRAVFPDGGLSRDNVGAALTRYVGSITAGQAPFDRWIAGDTTAIDASAQRGFGLFTGKAECSACHGGWSLSDGSFHDIGIATGSELGRGARFKTSVKLRYAFKTPTLRGVAERPPYMHDGSLVSLEAVVEHYDEGGIDRPSRDTAIHPLHLTASEKADLVSFLRTLSGPTQFVLRSDTNGSRPKSQ